MCGITGFIDRSAINSQQAITAMTQALDHRGPDDHGSWSDGDQGVNFGHRRLSILDLSAAGHQPMMSQSGRYVITFNGEIYNFQSIAEKLKALGQSFSGTSDTEVMLAAFEHWGVNNSVKMFNGMFAFGLWDKQERRLYLARDRMGEKPLYYGWNNGMFLFASELKALTANPKFGNELDRDAIAAALRYSYVPAPWSIYRNIFKLVPGSILELEEDDLLAMPIDFSPFAEPGAQGRHPHYYWEAAGITTKRTPERFRGTESEAIDQLNDLLIDAVGIRMISDVPIGAFLSGGIDSSLVVALMQAQSSSPVKTFSIGFEDADFNEAGYAKAVAKHLGTEHTELYLSAQDILDVIPMLPKMFDEPFSDSSQIPTYLVSKLCGQHVTVSLSGDGGDELFGGYSRYSWANNAWSKIRLFPHELRKAVSGVIGAVPASTYDSLFSRLQPFLPKSLQFQNPGQKLHTFGRVINFKDRHRFYHGLMSHWVDTEPVVRDSKDLKTAFEIWKSREQQPFLSEMMSLDMMSYLPDDIMAKVDRASMAVSLEARTPFLDHRVVEFALSLPLEYKIKKGQSKSILKAVLDRYVPRSLIDRPKMGFSIPISKWLRNELRDWAEDLLSVEKLSANGILRVEPIRQKWAEHLSGRHNWEHQLWDVLMLQAWLESHSIK